MSTTTPAPAFVTIVVPVACDPHYVVALYDDNDLLTSLFCEDCNVEYFPE
jgi:hypothetical protein